MRPSEFKAKLGPTEAPVRTLKFPVDPQADPPITAEEALTANGGLCPWHPGSLMGQRGDKEGMVYLCLHRSCRQYKRYEKHRGSSRQQLAYPIRAYVCVMSAILMAGSLALSRRIPLGQDTDRSDQPRVNQVFVLSKPVRGVVCRPSNDQLRCGFNP